MAVDDIGSTWKKRKKRSGVESPSKTRELTKGNHSQNQDGMVESEGPAAAEVKNEEEEEEESEGEEQEEESEGEEEEEEESEQGGDFGTSNGSRQTAVSIDTDVLDCSICCVAFRPPIYQCENGHAFCSLCCLILSGKCPVCPQPIGPIRCLALERVVESVQISCRYARYGCNTTLSYLQRDTHHKICDYIPCTCPISACPFKGSSISLSDHFRRYHRNSAVKFRYGKCCWVSLSQTENPFRVLLGSDGRLFLLLNNNVTTRGSALSMICISSRNEELNYECLLSVGVKTALKLKASVESTTEWEGVYPTSIFLFVPNGFCSSDSISVGVNIKKCKPF